jgi:hypothetical protein
MRRDIDWSMLMLGGLYGCALGVALLVGFVLGVSLLLTFQP